MLARIQHGDGLLGMEWNRRDQMHSVDAVIGENLIQVEDALFHFKAVADLLQDLRIGVADGQSFDVGVVQINGHELGAEAEPGEGDLDFAIGHRLRSLLGIGQFDGSGLWAT